MMGAFAAWLLLGLLGVRYWGALSWRRSIVGLFGVIIERLLLKRIYHLDHLYGLLLTFGLALIIEGLFRELVRLVGRALSGADAGGTRSRLHVHADLPRVRSSWPRS